MEETEYSDPRHLSYIVKADREDASSLHPFSVTTPLRRNDLPFPNVYYPFGHTELERCLHVLGAYPAELARNDYGRALTGRAMAAAVLGGRAGLRVRELPALAPALRRGSAEVCRDRGGWRAPAPHLLDDAPIGSGAGNRDITAWLEGPSSGDLLRG